MSLVQTHLLLIRHGQTPWNAAGRWQGHADPGLTPLGLDQAEQRAESMARETHKPWSQIVSSDLKRAVETASAIARALRLPIETDIRLRERDVGSWSGLTRAEIELRDRETLLAFETGEATIRPGGGESRIEIQQRAESFVRDLAARRAGEHVIVVTHLGVIRALAPGAEPKNAEGVPIIAEEIGLRNPAELTGREGGAL